MSASRSPLWRWACLALLCGSVIGSPVTREAQRVLGEAEAAPRKLHGKFLHITDFHPDEFYKVHASTAESAACHRGKGVAGTYGAETSDCDTPYTLVNATFAWLAEHVRDEIDFVIWTGDSARHDSDERRPRSAAQVIGSNRVLTNKFIDLLDQPHGRGLTVPVVPTFGNNDILPHNVLLPGPNKWLKQYADLWARFIPEEQRHSFEFGGWFSVEVIPNRLAVFSLNTLYFFDRNAAVDDCVAPTEPGFQQLEWLRIQLQMLRERGVKAILMGHVPPARTGSKRLWDETCWQKYTLWLRQYRDVVVGSFYGHMNIDHFLVQDTDEINYALLGMDEAEGEVEWDGTADNEEGKATSWEALIAERVAMEDEMDVSSAADYLQELRSGWSKLPKPAVLQKTMQEDDNDDDDDDDDDNNADDTASVDASKGKKGKKGKGKKGKGKGKKLSRKWGERYQVSLVSPSIVPNYLPTLRVVEYNISGLENAPVWTEGSPSKKADIQVDQADKADKGKDGDTIKDPNLTVPKGPAKTAAIGPAYSVQPLTLLGYTQYYANLTRINNDIREAGDDDDSETETDRSVGTTKWREGKHSDKDPKAKPAKPRQFRFEVEYSTFTDKIYNLSDLTVSSFLEIAYRMGKKAGKTVAAMADDQAVVEEVADADADVDATGKKHKKKKKAQNDVWLHFLRHAFVSTVDREELEKYGR